MISHLDIGPLSLTLIVTLFIWLISALGAATVFLTSDVHPKFNISSLGFAVGILISVSIFSLILPASEISSKVEPAWISVFVGLVLGVISIMVIYRVLPHYMPHHMHHNQHGHNNHLNSHHLDIDNQEVKKVKDHQNIQKRNRLLVISLVLHHVPENLALGIAFGAAYVTFGLITFTAAFSLAIGLAIHNFPEGMAAALPLRSEGMSQKRSFIYGQSIGIVAPFAGVIGALLVTQIEPIIPYALGFAAGAMLYVSIRHMIPHILKSQNKRIGVLFGTLGFVLMMIIEILPD